MKKAISLIIAVLLKRSDVDELKHVLQALLDNPEKVAEYKSSAADFINEKYNWDDVVDKTLEIYQGE